MSAASGDARTWLFAVGLVALLDASITRTPVLWGETAFEHTRDLSRVAFAQTYQATRAVYAPAPAARRVELLGNSRIYLAARPALVEAALAARGAGAAAHVDNLGIFGAGLGDVEVLSRHVERLDPALVVVALGTTDLLDTTALPLAGVPTRLLDVGLRDGPLPPADASARLVRWARTAWPLFRFREFARAAIADRLAPEPGTAPFPDHFADTHAIFSYMHGARAPEVEAAYAAWRARPTLANFVAYLERGSPAHLQLVRARTRQALDPAPDTPGLKVLDALLARIARPPGRALVVLMPENPLLAEDQAGDLHRAGLSERVAALVSEAAARHGVRVVDARTALGAEAFVDFDHPLPDLGGFHVRLADEIARALGA